MRETSMRYLKVKEVAERFGCSKVTLWQWVRLGIFPKPTYLGNKRPRWPEQVIEEHLHALREQGKTKAV
jgi:prophage regulatory protein